MSRTSYRHLRREKQRGLNKMSVSLHLEDGFSWSIATIPGKNPTPDVLRKNLTEAIDMIDKLTLKSR